MLYSPPVRGACALALVVLCHWAAAQEPAAKDYYKEGCALGADFFGNKAPELEKWYRQLSEATAAGSAARNRSVADFKSWFEKEIFDNLVLEQDNIESYRRSGAYRGHAAAARTLKETQIKQYFEGWRKAASFTLYFIVDRVNDRHFDASAAWYQGTIENECLNARSKGAPESDGASRPST